MRNLMAFEEQEYCFLEGHAVMVQGRNLSDDGQDSNGACKSALLEGIGISITGKPIRLDTSAKDLVRNGEPSSELEFELDNPVTKQNLIIRRELFSNTKSATLDIELNGKPLTQITSVNEGNERIFEILGIEKDDFLNYYLISKERYAPFYKLSDSKKKAVIGRFSNADMISPIEEGLDENITKIETENSDVLSKIEKNNIKIETFMNDMDSFSVDELKEKRDVKIASLKESIEDYGKKIKEAEEKLEQYDKDLDDVELKGQDLVMEWPDDFDKRTEDLDEKESKLRESIKVFDTKLEEGKSEIQDKKTDALKVIETKEQEYQEEMKSSKEELSKAMEMKANVDKGLMESIECPSCSHEFAPDNKDLNIVKAREKQSEIQSIIEDIESEIVEIRSDIDGLDSKRSAARTTSRESLNNLQEKYDSDVKEIRSELDGIDSSRVKIREEKKQRNGRFDALEEETSSIQQKIKSSNREIQSFNSEITSLNSEISTVEGQVIKDRKAEFKTQIGEIEEKNKSHEDDLKEIEGRLQKAKEEKELFLKFKTHLSNKAIAAIESHSNKYLEVAKSNIRVQLDGYKQNRSGEIREKITTTVLRDGIAEGGIGRFSSGEKARIEISNILAMKKMINNASPTGGLDMLVLDEITNSVDSTGIGGIMNMLEETEETTIHITHATFHSMYPHIQTVVKEGNVSTIIKGQYGEE